MKKIPLETTIVGAYRFLFTNIVSIIGTLWFPVLVFLAVMAALACGLIPPNWLHGHFTPVANPEDYLRSHLGLILLAVPVLILAGLLTGAMIRVGILRHALGEKTTITFIWFSLGARVWRMIAAALLYMVIYIGLQIVARLTIFIVALILARIPQLPPVVAGLVTAVLALAAVVIGIYIVARLFFFLPAVVVAENKVGVERAWGLGKGNVWRIVAVCIAVVLPLMPVFGVLLYVTVLSTIIATVVHHHPAGPAGPAEVVAFLKALLPMLPVVLGLYLVFAIATVGLIYGAIGQAYKAVTAPEETAA